MTDTTNAVTTEQPVSKVPIEAGASISAIIPRSFDEAYRIAKCFVLGAMVPNSYTKNASQDEITFKVTGAILKGAEIGLAPATSLETIMCINGRYALWGDGASALVLRSGKSEYMRDWSEGNLSDGTYVHYFETKRKDAGVAIVRKFGLEDAKKAGLLGKDTWRGYQSRMCFNRSRAWALRDAYADVLMGIAIVEEVQDIPVEERRRPVDTSDLGPVTDMTAQVTAEDLVEPKFVPCPNHQCDGGRTSDDFGQRDCPTCGGSGEVPV